MEMILHAKQEHTKFSIISLDLDSMGDSQKVTQTLTERGISFTVTTMNVFAERKYKQKMNTCIFIFKAMQRSKKKSYFLGSNILEAKIVQF